MMISKRAMDIGFSLLLLVLLSPVFVGLSAWLLWRQGRPIFFISDRMRGRTRTFRLIKFRTMAVGSEDAGVSGGNKNALITSTGRWMRRTRLDELPQLWNILKGDLSFVGPRPVLPGYARAFPTIYDDILQIKPGVTGLGTLSFRQREARLLSSSCSAADTNAIYVSKCIPKKARLDRHYIKTQSLGRDMILVFQTIGDLVRRV